MGKKTRVTFTHDDDERRWSIAVDGDGVEHELEARQAFTAVVLTCQYLRPSLLDKARVEGVGGFKKSGSLCPRFYKITPAIDKEQAEYQAEMDRLAVMVQSAEDAGMVVDVMPAEEMTPCQACGTPTPLGVSYCKSCESNYNSWTEMY